MLFCYLFGLVCCCCGFEVWLLLSFWFVGGLFARWGGAGKGVVLFSLYPGGGFVLC